MQSFEMLAAAGDPFALTEYHILREDYGCPTDPNSCHDHCQSQGFNKGECVGPSEDECYCTN